jgi:hypothetical protein
MSDNEKTNEEPYFTATEIVYHYETYCSQLCHKPDMTGFQAWFRENEDFYRSKPIVDDLSVRSMDRYD